MIEVLRNIRHHAVRSMLAEALKEVGFTVHQEVQGLATQGSVRRIDIIAIKNNSAYILDPTIRFETHADQPHEVDSEKKRIYEPTIPLYKDKYSLPHIDVIGLMVGARAVTVRYLTKRYIGEYSSNSGNLPRPGIEPGPPGFAARRADRYSTGVDCIDVSSGENVTCNVHSTYSGRRTRRGSEATV
ncbi:hypothetical protein ANN_06217 [Periplaneta americana]|uniref:Uncharacterized protein n=1 Tax=Periplaneta americana TaxID=6978 RepID=A0ABQ8TEY5_PERAM|nr:hypothetical protein ANN_06217 [Periplaneta americana]